MNLLSESGLYTMIFRSNKPQAKEFRKWVTAEVLSEIRRTGSYRAPVAPVAPKATAPVMPTNKATALEEIKQAFGAALGLAEMIGLQGNQAILSANKAVRTVTGTDTLALLGQPALPLPAEDQTFTPTQLGSMLGGVSAQEVNKELCAAGLQTKIKTGDKVTYVPTDVGKEFCVLVDTEKKQGEGAPVTQVKWKQSVSDKLVVGKR